MISNILLYIDPCSYEQVYIEEICGLIQILSILNLFKNQWLENFPPNILSQLQAIQFKIIFLVLAALIFTGQLTKSRNALNQPFNNSHN